MGIQVIKSKTLTKQRITNLERWIKGNPTARAGDSAAAETIDEMPFEVGGMIAIVPKVTLLCTTEKTDCILYRISTKRDINKVASQEYIQGTSDTHSQCNFFHKTIHTKTIETEFQGNSYISYPEWLTFRNQEYATGQIFHTAEGEYFSEGGAIYAEEGGIIAGKKGTTLKAKTSIGEYRSETTKRKLFSKKKTTIEAYSTHTTIVEIETGSPDKPFIIGSDDENSITTLEGVVSIGTKNGVGLVLKGGKGINLQEHLIPQMMKISVKKSGFLNSMTSKPDIGNIKGLRNIDSLKAGDIPGAITGFITDAVSAYKTYDAIKNAKMIKDLPMAGGIAIAAALFSEVFNVRISFGKEITIISQEGVTSMPNIIGQSDLDDYAEEGFLGIYSAGDVNIEHTKVNVKKIDGIILGKLNLKPGTDKQRTTVERECDTLNFDLSLTGLGVGVSHSEGDQETTIETHHKTEFFAEEITLVVDQNLNLEAAIIDGKAVNINAKEITIDDVIDIVKSRSNFVQMGVGVMFNFFGKAGISPQFSFGVGGSAKDSSLVKFISGITGQDVEITAKTVTASLEQVTASEDLRLFTENRNYKERPKSSSVHHQAWSVTGSVGIGLDGAINPSIRPSFEEDGVRISAVLSGDLFEGLDIIHM